MKKLLSTFILSLLFACSNDDLDPKNPVDSDIKIELREWISPGTQGLYLYAATEKIYPCVNYPLLFEQHFGRNRITITFTEVVEVNVCLTAHGPACKGLRRFEPFEERSI